jgi:hypothetical protein
MAHHPSSPCFFLKVHPSSSDVHKDSRWAAIVLQPSPLWSSPEGWGNLCQIPAEAAVRATVPSCGHPCLQTLLPTHQQQHPPGLERGNLSSDGLHCLAGWGEEGGWEGRQQSRTKRDPSRDSIAPFKFYLLLSGWPEQATWALVSSVRQRLWQFQPHRLQDSVS